MNKNIRIAIIAGSHREYENFIRYDAGDRKELYIAADRPEKIMGIRLLDYIVIGTGGGREDYDDILKEIRARRI